MASLSPSSSSPTPPSPTPSSPASTPTPPPSRPPPPALLFLRGAADWLAFVLFKAAYVVALLLLLSLVSTAAVVFCVASIYTSAGNNDGSLYFRRVIRAFPVVWIKHLVDTFLAAFVILLYNFVSVAALPVEILLLYC